MEDSILYFSRSILLLFLLADSQIYTVLQKSRAQERQECKYAKNCHHPDFQWPGIAVCSLLSICMTGKDLTLPYVLLFNFSSHLHAEMSAKDW